MRLLLPVLLLVAAPVTAQTKASESAKKFNLDPSVLQADEDVTAPPAPAEGPPAEPSDPTPAPVATPVPEATTPAPEPAAPAPEPAAAPAPGGALTLDTPIAALIADPHGKAVLDADLPGLSTDENLAKFSDKSLRQFQPLTGGQLTEAMLAKVVADLGGATPPPAPAKKSAGRRRDER